MCDQGLRWTLVLKGVSEWVSVSGSVLHGDQCGLYFRLKVTCFNAGPWLFLHLGPSPVPRLDDKDSLGVEELLRLFPSKIEKLVDLATGDQNPIIEVDHHSCSYSV